MEFLRSSRKRTLLSEVIYILLNVLVAVAVLVTTIVVRSPYPAFLLIVLSKWRVFAVRPQYWYMHIISNMVDIIVGLSFAYFIFLGTGSMYAQIAVTAFYIAWLLFLKPRSRRKYVVLQAGVGIFLGVNALLQASYDWWSSAVVLSMWVIGYASARHALSAYREPHTHMYSLMWGFVVAELGWIFYHWTFAYDLKVAGGLQIAQGSIIILLLSFLAERTYATYHEHQTIRLSDILMPVLLTVSVITVLVTVFGSIQTI